MVMPKFSAATAAVPLAGYSVLKPDGKPYEPVFVPPKGLTKPVITFPKDKSKPVMLNFVPKKVYDMEPEVSLNKNDFYDPQKLEGGIDSLVLNKQKHATGLLAGPTTPPVSPSRMSMSFPISPGFLQLAETVSEIEEPSIEAPAVVSQLESNLPKPNVDLGTAGTTAYTAPSEEGGASVTKQSSLTQGLDTMWDLGTGVDMGNKIRIGPMHLEDQSVEINAGKGGAALTENIDTWAAGGNPCSGISAAQLAGGSGAALKCMQTSGGMGPTLALSAGSTGTEFNNLFGRTPDPYGRACATCTFLLSSLEEFMKHSRTLRAVLPTVSGMCERCITQDEEKRCRNLIKKHGYKMYEIMVSRASAASFCPSLGYCFENYFMASPFSLPDQFAVWKGAQVEYKPTPAL